MDSSNFKSYKDKESRIFDDVSNNSEMSKKLEIPFNDLPLKVSNILRRNKLNDLDQLIGLEEKDYLALINFGSKAYSELKNSFEKLGLKIPITSQQLKNLFPGCEINSESEEDFQKKFIEFKIPYEKLGFPSEISDTLKWFGFFDLSDLIGLEEKDFLNFKNIDNESLEEIKILLDSYGLKIPISLDQSTKLLPKEKIIDDSFEFVNHPDEIGSYFTFEELKEFLSINHEQNINDFMNFESKIKELNNSPKRGDIPNLLTSNLLFFDDFQFENTLLKEEEFNINKKIINYFLLLKFINLDSFEKNKEWLFNFYRKNKEDIVFRRRIFSLIATINGITYQQIGDIFGVAREMIRQYLIKVTSILEINIKDLKEFSNNIKASLIYIERKRIIDQHFNEFGRLPIKDDFPKHTFANDEFYLSILDLKPAERIKLYEEYDLAPSEAEFDYHYEYFLDNEEAGPSYWNNFDFLKEYILRHAKALGEPDLMPKQTSFSRGSIKGVVGKFGGQSAVAKKIGLKYQGQLVNEGGGRKFWTNQRLIDLINDVNDLYDQEHEMMPSYGQVVDFFKSTEIELYKNKKAHSALAAMTSMGNLNWVETAEKFDKKIIPGKSQRINPNYIKAFVRDLGEHLAVLTPPELYVLFQAQGIGRKDDKYSRTFDLLIDAVQNGEVKKKDLADWSNNLEVPSIQKLLDLGSEISSKKMSASERELILLKRRSNRIRDNKKKPKVIDLDKLKKEDLPKLDPIKSLKALDKAASIVNESDSDLKLINFLKVKATAKLWDSCFLNEKNLIDNLESNYFNKDLYSSKVKESFLEEFYGAKNLRIPETYKFRDLKGISRLPKLMQKLVAFKVSRSNRLLNLSGTGTGKTLSAILAAQVCGCKRLFISCPNGVVDSWERAFESAFPSAVIHLKPENWKIDIQPNKVNVVIVNHERFQNRFSENLLRFCIEYQADMIVIDEIHQSKSRDPKKSSQRRYYLGEFIRISSNLKENIKVLGLSATPVINNLYEGASLIELITQKQIEGIKTNDISACMNLYQNFILNGIRMNPGHLSRTKIIPIDTDVSHLLTEVIQITNSTVRGNYHAIERLLVKPKLNILKDLLKRGEKTIVFITHIKGTLKPISNLIKKMDISFCIYTGEDKEATEEGFKDSLEEFIEGDTKVLIASIQCAGTGIDGLQSVCNNAIFFQLPWTSTEFEQAIGRLDRDGTEFEYVNVYIPKTTIKLPNGDYWSWCESKLERIESKKDIAKAAVDGDMPDSGTIISPQEATKLWLNWLKRLENNNIK